MTAIHFTDQDFETQVLKSKLPVLVDFYADWCGPCQQAAPVIDELAEEYKDKVLIGKVNVDENQNTSGKYGIMSIPTMVVFKEGKEVERVSGFGGKEGVVKLIENVLK
ncbi:MAG: thioredoxin [Patescibacteria group bacterium]|nr:thioredoxin [Patescibacteria group bacterium]